MCTLVLEVFLDPLNGCRSCLLIADIILIVMIHLTRDGIIFMHQLALSAFAFSIVSLSPLSALPFSWSAIVVIVTPVITMWRLNTVALSVQDGKIVVCSMSVL